MRTMDEPEVQYISNEAGEQTAVIVPIELWREIASERETAYLLGSEANRKRLLDALNRKERIPFEEVVEKLGL